MGLSRIGLRPSGTARMQETIQAIRVPTRTEIYAPVWSGHVLGNSDGAVRLWGVRGTSVSNQEIVAAIGEMNGRNVWSELQEAAPEVVSANEAIHWGVLVVMYHWGSPEMQKAVQHFTEPTFRGAVFMHRVVLKNPVVRPDANFEDLVWYAIGAARWVVGRVKEDVPLISWGGLRASLKAQVPGSGAARRPPTADRQRIRAYSESQPMTP